MGKSLPVTPFHYPVAYVLSKLGGKLSLPALVVGSMVPDLEVPLIVLLFGNSVPHHLLLHSLLGALTLGTALAIAITVLIYPKLTSAIFPVDKLKVKEKCRFTPWLVFSCALGCLSHVPARRYESCRQPASLAIPSSKRNPKPNCFSPRRRSKRVSTNAQSYGASFRRIICK